LKRLHEQWGDTVEFVTIVIRQGHPGPRVPAYTSYEQKAADARAHRDDDQVPWTVLVDELDGRVHRAYGMLADPTFLIDRDGRVAFYNVITHAPTLHLAITELCELGGLGVAGQGYDRRVHALPIIAGGWPAIARGLPQSAIDLELALPGGAALPFLGYQLRGVLAPVAQRGTPLPWAASFAWGMAAGLVGSLMVMAVAQRDTSRESAGRLTG
jgi:hypothetical protein